MLWSSEQDLIEPALSYNYVCNWLQTIVSTYLEISPADNISHFFHFGWIEISLDTTVTSAIRPKCFLY